MPPKKTAKIKHIKDASRGTPSALKGYQRVLNTIRADPKYKNKDFREQQQIASKIYKKL